MSSQSWPSLNSQEKGKADHGIHVAGRRRFSLRRKIIIGVVVTVVVLALVLGIGLGVGLRRSKDESPTSPQPTSGPNEDSPDKPKKPTEIWRPQRGTAWQIVLHDTLNDTSADVPVYDIDLFTNDAATIQRLHDLDRKVICYFSAGSYEDFRPDSSQFKTEDYQNPLDEWEGEWWVDPRSTNVRRIMRQRLDLAAEKGCDGVDPDNVDGYDNETGLNLTEADAADYVTFLADEGHARNLAVGLKNAGAIVSRVLDQVEWQVNEQCLEYDECNDFRPFLDAGKPVFHIEYPADDGARASSDAVATICSNDSREGFSTVIKELELTDWLQTCASQQ